MKASFWHDRWENDQIAFHESRPNPLLLAHFTALSLPPKSRVFVPLCGKSLDIPWLLSQGYRVAGAELSRKAIGQLFDTLGLTPHITQEGKLERFRAENLDIFVGDIFDLLSETLGHVDAIYDRAALVALPEPMRERYVKHVMAITKRAPQLLICYEYDQRLQEGPPFSISRDEVVRHYHAAYTPNVLAEVEVPGGLKGKCAAIETVWLLTKHR